MSKTIAGLAGAACLLFAASAANAATLSGSGTQAAGAASSSVVLAHGIHSACRRDKFGWHRSRPWGRQACAPAVSPAVPLALWMWRCADGHCGYWHKKEHRWKDGWKHKGKGKGKGKGKHH